MKCQNCKGTGQVSSFGEMVGCKNCKGTGEITMCSRSDCFTVDGSSMSRGIRVKDGKIHIGEAGRGRELAVVETRDMGLCKFGLDGSRERLEWVETPTTGHLVLFRGLAGFRGGASIVASTGCIVLASGYEAQGAAGRVGGADAALIFVPEGGEVKIERTGRLYGASGRLTFREGVLRDDAAEEKAERVSRGLKDFFHKTE